MNQKNESTNCQDNIEHLIFCGAEIQIDKFVDAKKKDKILETISEIGVKSVEK